MPNDRLIFETYSYAKGKGQFEYIYNSGISIPRHLFLLKNKINKRNVCENYIIIEILSKAYNIPLNNNSFIRNIIDKHLINYRIEKKYYRKLFSFLHPKVIFGVAATTPGMINAANSLDIPIVELQHGFIGYRHPIYSYPLSIKYGDIGDLPDYFFAFSHYWTKDINFPVKSIRYIGNSSYSRKIIKKETRYNITIIMGTFSNNLCSLIKDLLDMGYTDQICIKLHPHNDLYDKNISIIRQFEYATNITFIKNELSISELLSISGCIITVDSTCIYEALHNDVRVFLLNVPGYEIMQNIYENPLVKVINSAKDIVMLKDNNKMEQKNKIVFFEEFNENEFNKFMNELGLW
jgi:hypothetical protein